MAKKPTKPTKKPSKPSAPRRTEPVYTLITFVTFVAMAAGCALLYLDFDEYGQKSPDKEVAPTLPKLGEEPKAGPPAPKAAAADPMPMPAMP